MTKLESVLNAVKEIRHGAMCRIFYKSEPTLKAEWRKKGIKIVKYTESTVRLGVNYENIGSVIERKSNEDYVPVHHEYDGYWLVANILYHNNRTGTDTLRVTNVPKHANKHSYFVITDENGVEKTVDMLSDEQKEYITNSYFGNRGFNEVQSIKVDNVLCLAGESI